MASSKEISVSKNSNERINKILDKKFKYKKGDGSIVELPLRKSLLGNLSDKNTPIKDIIEKVVSGDNNPLDTLGMDLIPINTNIVSGIDLGLDFDFDFDFEIDLGLELTLGTIANLFILVRTQVSKLIMSIVEQLSESFTQALSEISDNFLIPLPAEIRSKSVRINTIDSMVTKLINTMRFVLQKIKDSNTVSFQGMGILILVFDFFSYLSAEDLETFRTNLVDSLVSILKFVQIIDDEEVEVVTKKNIEVSKDEDVALLVLDQEDPLVTSIENNITDLTNIISDITIFQNFLVVLDGINTMTTNLISDDSPFLEELIELSENAIKLAASVITEAIPEFIAGSIPMIFGFLPVGMSLARNLKTVDKIEKNASENFNNEIDNVANSLLDFIGTLRYIYKDGKPVDPSDFPFSGYSSSSDQVKQSLFQMNDEIYEYIKSYNNDTYENLDLDKITHEKWDEFREKTVNAILKNPTVPSVLWSVLTAESNRNHFGYRKINIDRKTDPNDPTIPFGQGSGSKILAASRVYLLDSEDYSPDFKNLIQGGYEKNVDESKIQWVGTTGCDGIVNDNGEIICDTIKNGIEYNENWVTAFNQTYGNGNTLFEYVEQEKLWNCDMSLLKLPLDYDIYKEAQVRQTHNIYGLDEYTTNDFSDSDKFNDFEPLEYDGENGPPTIGHALTFRTNILPNIYFTYDDLLTKMGLQEPYDRAASDGVFYTAESDKFPVENLFGLLSEEIKETLPISSLPSELRRIVFNIITNVVYMDEYEDKEMFIYPNGNDIKKYYFKLGSSLKKKKNVNERKYQEHYKSYLKTVGLLQKRPGNVPTLFGINIGTSWDYISKEQLKHDNRCEEIQYNIGSTHAYFKSKDNVRYKYNKPDDVGLYTAQIESISFSINREKARELLKNIVLSKNENKSLSLDITKEIDSKIGTIIDIENIKNIFNNIKQTYITIGDVNFNSYMNNLVSKYEEIITTNTGDGFLENLKSNPESNYLTVNNIKLLRDLSLNDTVINSLDLKLLNENKNDNFYSRLEEEITITQEEDKDNKTILYILLQYCIARGTPNNGVSNELIPGINGGDPLLRIDPEEALFDIMMSLHPTGNDGTDTRECYQSGFISNDYQQILKSEMIKSILSDTVSGEELRIPVDDDESNYLVSRALGFYDSGIDHVGHTLEKYYNNMFRMNKREEFVGGLWQAYDYNYNYNFDSFLENFHQDIVDNNNNQPTFLRDNDGENLLSQSREKTDILPFTMENAFGVVKYFGDTEIDSNIGNTDYEIIQHNSAGFPRSKSHFWSGGVTMSSVLSTSILKETFNTAMKIGTKEEFNNWLSPRNISLRNKCKIYPINNYFVTFPPPFGSVRDQFTPIGESKDYGYAWGNFYSGRSFTFIEGEKFNGSAVTCSFADLFGIWFQQPTLGYLSTMIANAGPFERHLFKTSITTGLKDLIDDLFEGLTPDIMKEDAEFRNTDKLKNLILSRLE